MNMKKRLNWHPKMEWFAYKNVMPNIGLQLCPKMRLMAVMNDFKNAVEKFPDCVDCYSLMAQVLTEQGNFDQADSFL